MMNGGVNGTMENSTETSLCKPIANEKTVASEECDPLKICDNGDIIEDVKCLDSKPNADASNSDSEKDEENGNPQKSNEEGLQQVSMQEISYNDQIDNRSSHSNESYPESASSSQGKSDSTEQQVMHSMDEKSKDRDCDKNYNKTVNAHDEETHEIESEGSSDEEGSVLSGGPRAEDTVSINSDSDDGEDSSQESEIKNKSNDVIILETDNRSESQNGNSQGSTSPEVHEVPSDNDDCVLTNDEKSNSSAPDVHPLRRSSRAVKRRNYEVENGEDESDIEEVEMEDPLSRKIKPIVINDTKTLVEMAAKKMKMNQSSQKKEPTVVIIDTNTGKIPTSQVKNITTNSATNHQNLYQSIIARGTTVTPISSKTNSNSQISPQNTQPAILPSLTDDMFVVEAPSFIVPYVYEKPSVKPFREFVDTLGKELEEEKAKEEKARLEKEMHEKEARNKLRNERKERGEDVSASEDETEKILAAEKKSKKAEKKVKRRGLDEDDPLWDGETSSETEDEILSDEDTVVIKDKADSIEELKDATESIVCNGKSDNYFDCSLGKFFVNIGLSLVQEYVQSDLLKQQNRKLYREKKSGHSTKETQSAIASLTKNLEFSKENNAPFRYPQKKCEFCSFKTESELVLNHHLETPHMKNSVYKCNFCEYEIRSPHDILIHMEAAHKIRGKLERAPAYHQCSNCPFEDNGKGKLARHQIACAKKFKPDLNLAPPIEWEPPAKIPKIARARNNMMGSYQNTFNRQMGNNMMRTPINIANVMPGAMGGFRARGRSPLAGPVRAATVPGAPGPRGGVVPRHNSPSPALLPNAYPIANNGKSKSMHQPSISITPLPRQPQPVVAQPIQQSKNTFVICEICDGYIKDLEQLRNHMQWIHKVKIHPKMIYNRPPLNCQKCQFRFFTDQGLERHLLGSHGLVTSSMQEAANKGNDAGRCPVCGRVYQWKLLNHVARVHNLTLKPAHLSYKCTVCTATFGMYKQFENHVYSAHSVVAKRVMDKNKASTPAARPSGDSLLKPLKINDEITIIPQPVKSATSTKTK